ncbi:hypothetical protein DFH01_17440 [Falsiroseomonas bella]|uniref:RapA2 cadherin-like domain-containing protein n=1 Tax=Falsiroseomonas bella TaxID=2184016 RepID=A0A317FD11_9PROT|nr:VCBS domain-containing protein [Falsiroseomonas bella]PWS35406.1 hypothetical protein DFH01_17440 [Falsiroseomonas bella]
MTVEPTSTTEYIWFGTRAVKFESGGNTGPQLELLDSSTDFATRTLSTGTFDFTGSEWQQFLAFTGTEAEMTALGIDLSNGVDTATAGFVNTTGDLRVGEGVEAYNIADSSGGGRLIDVTGTLDETDDPIAITGMGKANAAKLSSGGTDFTETGNRAVFSNDIGFGFINGSGFDSGGSANALRLNDGDAINFEIKQGKVLVEASFTVKVLNGGSTQVVVDSDGATIEDTNGILQGGFVQDASAGELNLGTLDHGTKVTINYVNGTIWFNGVTQFLGDTSGFFAAFQEGGSKNLTLGSVVGNQVGWSADDLVLATDIPAPANTPAVIGGNTTGDVQEDTPALASASGLLTIDDANGPADEVFIEQMNTQGLYGTFSVNADGSWTYLIDNTLAATQALGTGQTEQEVFTVVSADGTEVDVTINVAGLDEPPTVATLPDPVTGTGDPNDSPTLPSQPSGNYTQGNDNGTTYTSDDGAQRYDGNGGNDTISTGDGNDAVLGGDGNDRINTGDDNDYANGEAGADSIRGGEGNDALLGGDDNDTIRGDDGADSIYGQNGADSLDGDDDNDRVYGGPGADTIEGGDGGDSLYGGSGADSIVGNSGNDTIVGGYGADTATGNSGTDRFVFLSTDDTNDIITDFDGSEILDFSAFPGTLTFLATESTIFTANNQVAWYQSGGDTIVMVNTDGDNASAEFMVTLQGYTTNMVLNDFAL